MAIRGATSRCQRACYQSLLNSLASYLFGSPPNVVHHRDCPLASLQWMLQSRMPLGAYARRAPVRAEESTRITLKKRWFHSNGLREAPHHTAWHSLQHASIWYEVRRWPTTTVRAAVPCREGLRPGAALLCLWYR